MNLIIKNASEVVTCSGFSSKKGEEMNDLKIIYDGAVVIEDGIIKMVGTTDEVLANIDETKYQVIDAKGKAVLPGFVDSHTHFVFGGYRAKEFSWRLRGDSYMEIMERGGGIVNTVEATRNASKEELKELNEIHHVDVVRTFLGAHAVPKEYKGKEDEFIDHMIEKVLPEVSERNLAEFCDVFCEKNVFSIEQSRKLLSKAKELGMKAKLHADEIVQLGGAELASELHAVSADHLLQASDKGIKDMAKAGVVATLLPGTAFSLKEPYARARYMIDNGCAVALATDLNPGSCFTESIPLIFALATLYMEMTPEEAITALTINGAAAIDKADKIGSIDIGKNGDILILEFPSYKYIPYHVAVNTVEKVIKLGKVVYDKEKN